MRVGALSFFGGRGMPLSLQLSCLVCFVSSTRFQYDDLYPRPLLGQWNTRIVSLYVREMVGRKYSLGWL